MKIIFFPRAQRKVTPKASVNPTSTQTSKVLLLKLLTQSTLRQRKYQRQGGGLPIQHARETSTPTTAKETKDMA